MEPSMMQYKFFVIAKGRKMSIFTSFDEASNQVVDFLNAKYQGFNCLATAIAAHGARLHSMESEREALAEMTTEFGEPTHPPPRTPPTIPTTHGRSAPLYWIINPIPQHEAASGNYAINVNMEEWLLKVCYVASIPPPAFFRHEIGVNGHSIHYVFNVIILGNPLGPRICAKKGRYTAVELDARVYAAFKMLEKVLETTGQQIRDYNYLRTIMLTRANNELTRQVEQLEFKCRTHGYNSSPDLETL